MALRTDDLKAAQFLGFLIQLNIRTTARHIGGNGHGSVDTGICYDLSLQFMELGVQHLMLDAALVQHLAKQLGSLNCNGTNQHRLALFIRLCNFLNHCFIFFLFGLVYRILHILTDHRTVGGDDDNIHGIDVTELLLLGLGSTSHT